MNGSEIMVVRSILEHVIDGVENGSRHSTDCLLCTATSPQTVELGLQVAPLLADSGAGALDQCGLEPRRALAEPGGAAFAGAFVIAWTQTGPGYEVGIGGKPGHVDADLGEDNLRRQGRNAGDRDQQLDRGTKGGQVGIDLPIDLSDRRIRG